MPARHLAVLSANFGDLSAEFFPRFSILPGFGADIEGKIRCKSNFLGMPLHFVFLIFPSAEVLGHAGRKQAGPKL